MTIPKMPPALLAAIGAASVLLVACGKDTDEDERTPPAAPGAGKMAAPAMASPQSATPGKPAPAKDADADD
jgi:hypothetical protein